uniref:Replication timing regulatory factor 1 n=1 Tax=Lates calcarifer TaxID=8187 RepID=A0A4W6F1L7_LATCA
KAKPCSPPSSSSFLPLLESLEDSAAGQSEQTDAYLTIANRLSGEEGRQFLPAVEKHFSRLGKAILAHITSPNAELSQAALQALGFCVYHSHVVSGVPETFAAEIISALCSLVVKSTDKNTCTRALWVISKQSFPSDVVGKKVPSILGTLEMMEHEALNVVIRMLEQVPAQMGDGAVRWAKLVIPLVVHSAPKVRLRAAAAMELGMPLLLEKQMEVAAIIEPMMSTKLIPELQKLFMSKNETNVLKLWPLFVKLLGKLLHRGGPFINSLLHLEELGFRSSSPTIKKIAFIAWKSLIDNFSLNPDILCSAKRMKLLMQPLTSIHVRTEALLLTKVEVWWYLVVQLGPNLSSNFDQVRLSLLLSLNSTFPGTPSRAVAQNGAAPPGTPKTGTPGFNSPANTSRMSLNSSVHVPATFPSTQLLGLEMLLHYFLGPEAVAAAAKRKLILSLEPLNHPLLSGASSFSKHATVLISNIRDGFTNIGKDAPDSLLAVLWTNLVRYVNLTIESGNKKDRQGCEVLTLMLQALQSIVTSGALPVLFEATVKGLPQRVLGSASYQVGKMDVLNGTPALFLILLLYNSSMLSAYIEDERFFQCLQTLVGCGLSGPTSPLAFAEAVLGAIRGSAGSLQNKEQLWRMWSVMVSPLTDTITQSNEVNQGDALEHNFSAMHSWVNPDSDPCICFLYKVFARCSALVVTAEENICCEELCAKMTASIDKDLPSTLHAVASILQVMVECVDFSPYTPQFQQKLKSPHTPVNWMKKRNKALGNLTTFQSLLVQCLEVYLEGPEDASSEATGVALVSILSALFTNLTLANAVQEALFTSGIYFLFSLCVLQLEKLLSEVFGCLQSRSTLAYNDELLALLSPLLCVLFPHKNKQLRTSATQFWNSTFANSVSLTYPEEIRPILSLVKQKIPIILPGFEVVTVSDELSGQYSSESSQLETKLSGMPISSVGKRDSLLGKAADLKDKSSAKTPKPTKLDFSSPKPPRREVLEEEASIDFVFIPPETKERVLTEHQKEVKRTKRVDIPAMYNNLDASLDTTVFSQYTQSQEDSLMIMRLRETLRSSLPPLKHPKSLSLKNRPEKEKDSSVFASSPINEFQDRTNKSMNESECKDGHKTKDSTDDNLSQEDSQVITPLSSDSQSLRRSRRSKASSEATESEDTSDRKNSSGRQSRSNSQTTGSVVSQAEVTTGGRTRRSKAQEGLSKSSPSSTPESSESLDFAGSAESSQSRGRYSRRRSSQPLIPNMESSESESSEVRENLPIPKKRGRKPRASLPSPLTLDSKENRINNDIEKDVADASQRTDMQSIEAKNVTDLEESQKSQDSQGSESLQVTGDPAEQINKESPMEVEPVAPEHTEIDDTERSSVSPREKRQRDSETNIDNTSSQESNTGGLEMLEPVGISDEQIQEKLFSDPSAVDTPAPPEETTEKPQVSESSEDKAEDVSESEDRVKENPKDGSDSDHQEHPAVLVGDMAQDDTSSPQNQVGCPNELSKEDEQFASNQHTEGSTEEEITPLQENDEDGKTKIMECQDEEKTQPPNTENNVVVNLDAALTDLCDASVSAESTSKDVFQDSPVKQKDLGAVMGSDVGQSPSSGRTRGTWSPSASPSTSILKKGQKRPLEEETPSPLVKSRRVSFADPIQQQETADDIDRRSPALRTSSPRRSKVCSIPQPKYVTTPTKGLLILSPRNLRSPGYKSSKKCLISEMSQEPRPVSKDCIYPALVGCSAPVEAVLPQISSNMWSRGFGQLVRARNIKTVGDLSALTPNEIKTLPIRSPKISNVKKALKNYEQQVSTELVDEPVPADGRPQQDNYGNQTPDTLAGGEHHQPEGRLLSEVEALTCRMTPLELSRCSPQQLVQMHDQLGCMMRRVVVELQTRLCQTADPEETTASAGSDSCTGSMRH